MLPAPSAHGCLADSSLAVGSLIGVALYCSPQNDDYLLLDELGGLE